MGKIIKMVSASDIKLFYYVNTNIRCRLLDILIPLITHMGGAVVTIMGSLSLMIWGKDNAKIAGYMCGITLATSQILVHFLKNLFSRERPYARLFGVNAFRTNLKDYSFPSGHTAAAFSMAISISLIFPALLIPMIFLALAVGFSRIYLGVHYPTDVIIGMIIGIAFAMLINLLMLEKFITKAQL